jgi:pimeloyl-ACP methyl ester carboxylesterase
MPTIELSEGRVEVVRVGPGPDLAPTLVFLHEGLGSASLWRDFPAALAAATGCGALVYSRLGYGGSDPLDRAFDASFMHREALDVLPRLLEACGVADPVLVGHSDGASIALIYAAAGLAARALALEAPHVFVEPLTVESIAATRERYAATDLAERMRRHHGEKTDATFRAWTDVWLSDEFRGWDIRPSLGRVACPVLVVQGEDDEYGTLEQLGAIASLAPDVETVVLERCGHAPHRDRPEATLEAMRRFVARVT